MSGPDSPLTLIRIADPNEALGLAVRLVASVPPFNEFPLGTSVGNLIAMIDRNHYAFVRRSERAVGFAGWGFASHKDAERWLFERVPLRPEACAEGPCALIMAVRAIDAAVSRYLMRRLRDDVFRDKELAYYIRDYGRDAEGRRRIRAVRLKRPAVHRAKT